jgi:hypothetical protein
MDKGICVRFKSVPENYEKEKSGRKPNTVRVVAADDLRFPFLNDRTAGSIEIINSETEESFRREITDITFWDGRFIISWKQSGN